MTVRTMETKFRLFCVLSRKLVALRIALGPDSDMAVAVREDMEAIALHSDWPKLRAAVGRALSPVPQEAMG